MNNFLKHIQKNKISWNKRTRIHIDSDFYNNNLFKKNQSSLKSIETEEIGNINNKELLHLQCHFGQDSISLARKGANVTAVDFSKNAIQYAKKMAQELEVPINFIEEDVLQLNLRKEFDIVFTSYGVIGWLPDLDKWANIIVQHLKKGGFFLLTEFISSSKTADLTTGQTRRFLILYSAFRIFLSKSRKVGITSLITKP